MEVAILGGIIVAGVTFLVLAVNEITKNQRKIQEYHQQQHAEEFNCYMLYEHEKDKIREYGGNNTEIELKVIK
ncbi:MAG TPA: hypothetical protein O0X32_01275 [Methanocorpusculum sp.]|nr:hypothetical protein [Methanocorpusculum sp.]